MKVVVIGGGIIGLCAAHYAQEAGHDVTVIDQQPEASPSTSTGNAGMIVPSHFVPLAAPGMIQMGLKMMLNPRSPFGFRFPPSLEQIAWTWKFMRAANPGHVRQTETILRDLNLESRRLYTGLMSDLEIEAQLRPNGLLMLCQSEATLDHEASVAKRANEIGLKADVLSAAQLAELDPSTPYAVAGAVHFRDDASITPPNLVRALRTKIRNRGGTLMFGEAVTSVKDSSCKAIQIYTDKQSVECDEVVIASGAWSGAVTRLVDKNLPMLAGRGYGFTIKNPPSMPAICAILTEARVAMTPMTDGLRFTGTMELGPPGHEINQARVDGIKAGIQNFLPEFGPAHLDGVEVWEGNRPCSPDGLPYIGRISENVIVASGHGMMGLSLGPITGKLVAELVSRQSTTLPLDQLSPRRFSA